MRIKARFELTKPLPRIILKVLKSDSVEDSLIPKLDKSNDSLWDQGVAEIDVDLLDGISTFGDSAVLLTLLEGIYSYQSTYLMGNFDWD